VLGLGAAGLGLWGFWWFGIRHSYRAFGVMLVLLGRPF
jgi:hypothetical protein